MFFAVTRIKRIVEKSICESIDIRYALKCLNKVLKSKGKGLTKKECNFILYSITGVENEEIKCPEKKVCWGVALCLSGYILHHLSYSPAKIDGQKVYYIGITILLSEKLDGY